MDKLSERVERALREANAASNLPYTDVPAMAQVAIAIILEAAAKCADDHRTDDDSMWDRAAQTIATAIRAMGEREG